MWSESTVIPILLAQIALAVYYLALPVLRKVVDQAIRLSSWTILAFTKTPLEASEQFTKTSAYRGKWRDAAYTRSEADTRAEPTIPTRPRNPLRAQHLSVLGLRDPAHLMEVKHAYRTMAKTFHPDRYASPAHSSDERREAAERMREVNQAYDWLCANV